MKRRRKSGALPEVLEARVLLSNVTARVTNGGDLIVTGDAQDNTIRIEADSTEVRVVPIGATTVNGSSAEFFVSAEAARDDVKVSLVGGDNKVLLTGRFQDEVRINGGPGRDVIGVDGESDGGKLTINSGGGSDLIALILADFDKINVKTGDGADKVVATDVFADQVSLSTGRGGDQVAISDKAGVNGTVDVRGKLTAKLGPGRDAFGISGAQVGQLKVAAGSGNDEVGIEDVVLGRPGGVSGGSGNDDFTSDDITGQLVPKAFETEVSGPLWQPYFVGLFSEADGELTPLLP